jgi:hypothetical protein
MPKPALPVFALALLLQLPLILNPGYYSHDELQWAAFAQAGAAPGWTDLSTFQYRPLTFSVWMALSRALFDTPMLFHGVLVAWGALNAALLALVARGFGLASRTALAGALAFVLTPYAAYTHGWVGCIADLLWVNCALLLALSVQHLRAPRLATLPATLLAGLLATLLTGIALLAKEAGFAIPALLLVAAVFDRARRPRWTIAMLASAAVCALYLWLRLDTLLHAPRDGAQYALSAFHLPLRWFEYQVFAPIPPVLEAFTVLQRPIPVLIAIGLWLALVIALWRACQRCTAVFLLGGVAALLPVLPLGSSWNHYGYGFAAVACMAVAAAWPHATRGGRLVIAAFALLTCLHGAVVMARMHTVGRIQSVFSPALAAALKARPATATLALRLDPDAKAWVFQRLTHDIPSYAGVAVGTRVRLVDADAPADYRVSPDGRLQRLP